MSSREGGGDLLGHQLSAADVLPDRRTTRQDLRNETGYQPPQTEDPV